MDTGSFSKQLVPLTAKTTACSKPLLTSNNNRMDVAAAKLYIASSVLTRDLSNASSGALFFT